MLKLKRKSSLTLFMLDLREDGERSRERDVRTTSSDKLNTWPNYKGHQMCMCTTKKSYKSENFFFWICIIYMLYDIIFLSHCMVNQWNILIFNNFNTHTCVENQTIKNLCEIYQ